MPLLIILDLTAKIKCETQRSYGVLRKAVLFMKFEKIKSLVTAALFAAIICVATAVVKIPTPATGGFFNLGDCFVLLAGFFLGPVYGGLAAGIGSALTDILGGYMQYAPATFVIKALMAVAAYFIYKALKNAFKGKFAFVAAIIAGIVAEAIMVLGYFGYEAVVLGYGLGAAGSVFANVMQGVVGVAASTAVSVVIEKSKTLSSFFKRG